MSPIGKVFVVLNLVFSLVVLGVLGGILSKSEEWKKAHSTVKAEFETAQTKWTEESSDLRSQISNHERDKASLTTMKNDLDLQVKALQQERDQAQTDMNVAQNNLREVQADMRVFATNQTELQNANAQLVSDSNSAIEARNAATDAQLAAEADSARARSENERLSDTVAQLKSQIEALEAERGDLSAQIEAAVQAGFDISKVRAFPKIDGVVEKVNQDLGLAILSVGRDDGVTRGMKFYVFGAQFKGECIVDDIYPDHSAARIVPNSSGRSFSAMDKATTRL